MLEDHQPVPLSRAGSRCTVVMLAQNEEHRIEPALGALREHGFPVVVVDGGSTDATVAVAEGYGATVRHRSYDNMSAQLNWAIDALTSEYVLVVDADEVMSPELAADIDKAIETGFDGAWVTRLDYFSGRWLTHYPQRHLRLFRRGVGRYEHEIHQRFAFAMENPTIVELTGPLTHPSHLDVTGYITKLNVYTDMELRGPTRDGPNTLLTLRAAAEGVAAFGRWYFIRSGWRDGRHGFIHCVYLGVYRFTLWAKAATAEHAQPPTAEAALATWRRTRGGR